MQQVQTLADVNAAVSDDNMSRDKRKHLIFGLGGKRYGIPLSRIKEVIGMCHITAMPNVPTFYKGMINLRGQIISVIDLRLKLGFKASEVDDRKTAIIISHVGDILVGTIVDEVIEVVGYTDDQINRAEAERLERSGDGIYGIAKEDTEDLTLLIDIEKALDKTDFKVLKQKAA